MPYIDKSKSDSWSTPQNFKENLPFEFDDYDPCPLNDNPNFDGLQEEWAKTTFVNPPYGKLKTTKKNGIGWVEKAHIECKKGKTIVMLIPTRTDTSWFHDNILKNNYEIEFIRGRLKFSNSKNPAPFSSMLVYFKL